GIGRSHENDVILDDQHVSRFHAQVRLRFGHYVIFDADSASGTFVNDVRVREHRLQTGDVIRIGGTSLVYMQDDTQVSGDTAILNNI
ncbi:MAG: FHA domain-containing protein, partial [Anaerolineae bacterium]|nr:FHA domain-containing protein [Anaerolineae bacterium]